MPARNTHPRSPLPLPTAKAARHVPMPPCCCPRQSCPPPRVTPTRSAPTPPPPTPPRATNGRQSGSTGARLERQRLADVLPQRLDERRGRDVSAAARKACRRGERQGGGEPTVSRAGGRDVLPGAVPRVATVWLCQPPRQELDTMRSRSREPGGQFPAHTSSAAGVTGTHGQGLAAQGNLAAAAGRLASFLRTLLFYLCLPWQPNPPTMTSPARRQHARRGCLGARRAPAGRRAGQGGRAPQMCGRHLHGGCCPMPHRYLCPTPPPPAPLVWPAHQYPGVDAREVGVPLSKLRRVVLVQLQGGRAATQAGQRFHACAARLQQLRLAASCTRPTPEEASTPLHGAGAAPDTDATPSFKP